MKATVAFKFKEDYSDKEFIDSICKALESAGIRTTVIVRDYEKWGEVAFSSQELMRATFEAIDACDMHIVELSQKGVGLGIEAGYAFAKGKSVIVIAKTGTELSETMKGIANKIITYDDPSELASATLYT